jgi:hypothetical protein
MNYIIGFISTFGYKALNFCFSSFKYFFNTGYFLNKTRILLFKKPSDINPASTSSGFRRE